MDVLLPGFKNTLSATEYAKGQLKNEKENCSKKRQVMGFFGKYNIDFRKMDDQGQKFQN